MRETFRAGVDGIPCDQAGVPWVGPQVVRQPVRKVGQVGQGRRVSRVVPCYGCCIEADSFGSMCCTASEAPLFGCHLSPRAPRCEIRGARISRLHVFDSAASEVDRYAWWVHSKFVATKPYPSAVTLASEVVSFGCHSCLRNRSGTPPGRLHFKTGGLSLVGSSF